jgi:hypothetical protein
MAKRLSPQEMMAQRNPLTRAAVAPVDIYNPSPATPKVEPEVPTKTESAPKQERKAVPAKTVREETPKPKMTRAAAKEIEVTDSPYSTYLFKKQVKGIKLRAIEEDVNDKEIVQRAIDEYFKNHPL